MPDEDSAPGWDAIDLALKPRYGDQIPLHWGTAIPRMLGGPDPIDGISAYLRSEPISHWHFITYGFSELYSKDNGDPTTSGYGFELTFRLTARPSDKTPPNWALNFLQNLGRYVFSSGNGFDRGHYMHLNGPIALGSDTRIRAIVFDFDPEIPAIDTPHGHLVFLQVVGITLDELETIKSWSAEGFLELASPQLPLLVTDLDRPSLLDSAMAKAAVQTGVLRDGSSTGVLFVGAASWSVRKSFLGQERLHVVLGANGVRDFRAVLPGRTPFGRELSVVSPEQTITFVRANACSWSVAASGEIKVAVTPESANQLAEAILPKEGIYRVSTFPGLVVHVRKSEIKDKDGKVVEVVG